MITDKEARWFWFKFDLIILSWNIVSAFFLASLLPWYFIIDLIFNVELHWTIWSYYLLIPFSFLLKYVLKVKGWWFFNDSVDGDFGSYGELSKKGYENKPKWFRFIWWWFRNHSWNYIELFVPTSNGSDVFEHRIFFNTRDKFNPEWLKEEGSFLVCYRGEKGGPIECRYSKITGKWERHFGAGGHRYKMHFYKRK